MPTDRRKLRHSRIRKKVSGTSQRPRLCVHISRQHIYVQVVDDGAGRTLVAASTLEPELRGKDRPTVNVGLAEKIGTLVAERTLDKNVKSVVFDRGGSAYHGRVKALADAARAAGLEF
jgi:large subunit ribosomal protein L18